jgi:ADP-heptose:LPS heptosyltransferase
MIMRRIRFIKSIDGFFACILTSWLTKPEAVMVSKHPTSFLIIRPGGIGDALLLAPVIAHLKHLYLNSRITVLAERRNAGVCTLIPAVDNCYCYDKPAEFMHGLQGNYDVVIDTEQWHRLSAIVARLVRAPIKIGFGTNERSRMFTHSVSYSHDDYEMASFSRLLEPLTGSHSVPGVISPFLSIPSDVVHLVAKLLAPLGDQQIVVIFPGASIAERRWGAARFKAVAELLQQKGYGVVVVGGADDLHDGLAIAGDCGLNLAGKTTLAETAAVLARAGLLISGDSGVLHIAVGLGIPTVSLFGPGRALKWAPQGDHHTVLNKGLPCSPCTTFGTTPPCPHKARCMQEITVAEVVNAAIALLQKKTGATD